MEMTITQFKAKCLGVVERVQREKIRVVVSRHGRPAAQLVPVEEHAASEGFFGRAGAETKILGDILTTGIRWDAEH